MFKLFFSNNFISAIIRMATPLVLTSMAANIGRQADVVCQCFEGMMLAAAFGGVVGSYYTGSLIAGMFIGIACGVFIALFFGYFVIYLDTHPMLMSIAMNTLGLAGTTYASYLIAGSKATTTSLTSSVFPTITIKWLEKVPVLGGIFYSNNILTYLAFVSVPVVSYLIYKTALGLKIRATGRNPVAAETMGIDTKKIKLTTVFIQGILSSFSGMFMSMAYLPYFTQNMTAGRGFMAIAANNLGLGDPIKTLLWCLCFGASMGTANILQSFNLPSEFATALPYIVTLIGLCLGVGNDLPVNRSRKAKKATNE